MLQPELCVRLSVSFSKKVIKMTTKGSPTTPANEHTMNGNARVMQVLYQAMHFSLPKTSQTQTLSGLSGVHTELPSAESRG